MGVEKLIFHYFSADLVISISVSHEIRFPRRKAKTNQPAQLKPKRLTVLIVCGIAVFCLAAPPLSLN